LPCGSQLANQATRGTSLVADKIARETLTSLCMRGESLKRILIVDDHEVLREGVKRIFDKQPGETIFGEASTGQEALKLAREKDWDIVVLDLSLGSRSGLEVLKELKQLRPRLPVLILSMYTEVQFARRAFKAGASGYITKDSPRSELTKAINKVIDKGTYVAPALAEKLVVDIRRGADRPPHETLSDREFEVMRLIASGKTAGEIADVLSLSDSTISTYRARILEKMGMKTNAELIHYAIQNDLAD
jgi:two-component system invasion response regulator UvrY